MKRHLTEVFLDESYTEQPGNKYPLNKTIHNILSVKAGSSTEGEIADYRTSNNKRFGYIFVIIDICAKCIRCIPLKIKNGQTILDKCSKILTSPKRKPNEIESDEDKEFYTSVSRRFLQLKNIHQ